MRKPIGRSVRRLSVGGAILLGACTQQYLGSGPPVLMMDSPFGLPEVLSSTPPPTAFVRPGGPAPIAPGSLDGVYNGVGVPLNTGGGECFQNEAVNGFRVSGDAVRWGGFAGSIAPDGGLQMVYGAARVFGQFDGPTFHGQISLPGPAQRPGCTYVMNLARTGG